MTGRGVLPQHLPLLFVLNRLINWRVETRPCGWKQMPGGGGSISGEQRGGSLFARLSAWLLFWLTSAGAWDSTSAPAPKHTSPSAPHSAALLLLLLLQATAAAALGHHLLLDHVDDLIRDAQVLDGAAADVALRHPPEFVPVPGRADHFTQVDVHPVVAAHQVPIVRLPVFELHQLERKRVPRQSQALRGVQTYPKEQATTTRPHSDTSSCLLRTHWPQHTVPRPPGAHLTGDTLCFLATLCWAL